VTSAHARFHHPFTESSFIVKYAVVTCGCRVNQADSLGFEEGLLTRGATPAASPETADVVIVNTCSVTASADQSARQTVRRLARINPNARIVVTGCSATRRPAEFNVLPQVLRVFSNQQKPELVASISAELGLTSADRYGDGDGSCGATIKPGVAGRTAYTLRVQTGCAQPCSYCIIPTTRGEPRSHCVDAVITEVDRIAAAGFKELALTGVHLGSFGRDLNPRSSLAELLKALAATEHRFAARSPGARLLFRISSLEPMDCSPEIVARVAGDDCFARHFHLPLQHASNRILTAMRRPYTIGYYADLVESIRTRMPDVAIGSDVMVGFPGETDADFECLCRYLADSPLTHLHVFPYSDRPATEASRMTGKVPGVLIRMRAQRIREIGHGLARRFRESQVGSVHRGLTIDDGSLVVTSNYLKVKIPPGQPRNQWLTIRVAEGGATMTGEIEGGRPTASADREVDQRSNASAASS
jgi:threonylcarbamoyladenosine tRNA methylthiotransferase MtaB